MREGSADYGDVPADTLLYKAVRLVFKHVNVSAAVPPQRLLLLEGESASMCSCNYQWSVHCVQ
jgi:hypothetical protein